jgi:hypothetical protein
VTRAGGDPEVAPGRRRRALRIGLTGPIGCGKTTISGWLAARGAVVIDADRLARVIVEPGEPALDAIAEAFGPQVVGPDGTLDRAALADIVFADGRPRPSRGDPGPAVRPRILRYRGCRGDRCRTVVLEAIRLSRAAMSRSSMRSGSWSVTRSSSRPGSSGAV